MIYIYKGKRVKVLLHIDISGLDRLRGREKRREGGGAARRGTQKFIYLWRIAFQGEGVDGAVACDP